MRRVCLTIGVSRAEGLAPLRAAATAAEEIGEWARLSGFADPADICVLTDRKAPVTVDMIKQAITTLLPMGKSTDAFLLHFAGHGLREDSTRTLWLPTDWQSSLRAIAVEKLKNRLSDFGIANLTIISDACKALANDKDSSDLTADGVMGAGTSAGVRPILDRYDAVHDIESAFMVPGETPEESRCIFSGALVEALWGRRDDVFDPHFADQVTPGSLADFLTVRVRELCKTYGLACEPQMTPGRPADHLIYYKRNSVPAANIPPARDWPPPVKSGVTAGAQGSDLLASSDSRPAAGEFLGDSIGISNPDISFSDRATALPDDVQEKIDVWSEKLSGTTVKGVGLDWLKTKARGEVERALVADKKARLQRATRNALSLDDVTLISGSNLVLRGMPPKAVWSAEMAEAGDAEQWRVEMGPEPARQIVVEYPDGVHVPMVLYPDMVTIAARDAQGAASWMFVSQYGPPQPSEESLDILLRMQAGNLAASEVDQIVAHLREMKHANPMVGAICSYLYDYVGDLDSIRRMAYFYVQHGQAIPFDVALMGELHIMGTDKGYAAMVPSVGPRVEQDHTLPGYVTGSTSQAKGPVGGYCPWLRQGWDFVESPSDREAPLVQQLQAIPDLQTYLLPQTFTCFDKMGGKLLVKHWQMKARKP